MIVLKTNSDDLIPEDWDKIDETLDKMAKEKEEKKKAEREEYHRNFTDCPICYSEISRSDIDRFPALHIADSLGTWRFK